MGSSHMAVCTADPLAQRYFDQGLRFMVAYTFKLALVNFMQAQSLDPQCAMCAWGEAMARGQNLNEFMDASADNVGRAMAALERAVAANGRYRAARGSAGWERKETERPL